MLAFAALLLAFCETTSAISAARGLADLPVAAVASPETNPMCEGGGVVLNDVSLTGEQYIYVNLEQGPGEYYSSPEQTTNVPASSEVVLHSWARHVQAHKGWFTMAENSRVCLFESALVYHDGVLVVGAKSGGAGLFLGWQASFYCPGGCFTKIGDSAHITISESALLHTGSNLTLGDWAAVDVGPHSMIYVVNHVSFSVGPGAYVRTLDFSTLTVNGVLEVEAGGIVLGSHSSVVVEAGYTCKITTSVAVSSFATATWGPESTGPCSAEQSGAGFSGPEPDSAEPRKAASALPRPTPDAK